MAKEELLEFEGPLTEKSFLTAISGVKLDTYDVTPPRAARSAGKHRIRTLAGDRVRVASPPTTSTRGGSISATRARAERRRRPQAGPVPPALSRRNDPPRRVLPVWDLTPGRI